MISPTACERSTATAIVTLPAAFKVGMTTEIRRSS
jgi:hypothetical protein